MLYPFKQFVLDNAWHSAGSFNVLVNVNSDIPLVSQKPVQAIFVELFAEGRFDLLCIQMRYDFRNSLTAGVHLENLPYHSGRPLDRINTTRIYLMTTFREHQAKIDRLGLIDIPIPEAEI